MWLIEQTSLGRVAVPPFVPEGFTVFCTTRDFPGRITDASASVITSAVEERLGTRPALTTCNQIHSATVSRAGSERAWQECDSCDALWSDESPAALAIKIADCLPVSLIDATHGVIANVHSGWRGTAQRITAATLDTLTRDSAFDAGTARAYLGPSIRVCCFEVGEEVASQFDEPYVDRTEAKPHVDLVALTRDVLLDRGVLAAQISDSGICTRCDGSLFHSYRRDGSGGRNLAIVAR